MANLISSEKVARTLNISLDDVKKLSDQGILHLQGKRGRSLLFLEEEVRRIKEGKGLTVSDEAEKVGSQIEREVVTSVSSLKKFGRVATILGVTFLLSFSVLVVVIASAFRLYPRQTSDFFGYYYSFNVPGTISLGQNPQVLAAETGNLAEIETSILADILKPVAATSLVFVKAADEEQHKQIVTNPILSSDFTGPAGVQGPAGRDGANVADVTTTVGDIIVRNSNNQISRLGVGSEDQILTILSGIPFWRDLSISGLTNSNLSGSAGITNANLADSSMTINSGDGLTGGGTVSLGGSTSLSIGAGSGISVNSNDISINLTALGTTGSTSSNSGLEVSTSGLSLLHGCNDGEILKWTDAGGWSCSVDSDTLAPDLIHVASHDTNEAMTNITSTQVTLGSVTVTPTTSTQDVYLRGHANVFSSSAADQPFTLVIETTDNCTGSTVGNATVTYTITSGASGTAIRGSLNISGIANNPGTSSQSYSLCASTSAGDTDVQGWSIEALVLGQ